MPSHLSRALPALTLPLTLLPALLAPGAYAQYPAAPTLTSVHTFGAADQNTGANADGSAPFCALFPGGDGFLYGTTEHGGTSGNGTVFRLHPNGAGFQVLHDFGSGTQGSVPIAALISGGDGFLYGTASIGGANSNGTVFRLHPDGTGYQDLHDFTGADGQFPGAALLALGDGFLYGRTAFGVFRLHPDGTGFGNVYAFTDSTLDSRGTLIAPGDGFLYGTNSGGGGPNFNANASVFRLHPDGTGYQEVYVFKGQYFLSGSLLAPGDGFLYGTTQNGGPSGTGSVFRLHSDGTGFADLHDFGVANANTGVNADGSAPNGALVVGGDGFLYGEAQAGGADNYGTVFRLHPDGTGFADLHDFIYAVGGTPLGEPVILGDGFLYGTTQQGGANFTGTVFRLTGPPVTHVLWDNPDGRTIFWDVNTLGAYGIAGNYAPFTDPNGNGGYVALALSTGPDGLSHVLWRAPGGRMCLWTVQADGSHTDFFYGPFEDDGTANTIWQPVALSTGGDGLTHVLWSNPNGRTILWDVAPTGSFTIVGNYDPQTDGTGGPAYAPFALATGPDGLSHVLWNNSDGRTLLWDLNAQAQPTPHVYGPFSDDGSANTIWQARALSVGPDGVPHVLWNNPNGRTILWDVDSQGNFTIKGNYGPFQDDSSGNTGYTAVSLTTGLDALSHLAWDDPDGNTYLWSVQAGGGITPTFFPPFLDDGTSYTIWKAVAVSAANAASTTVGAD